MGAAPRGSQFRPCMNRGGDISNFQIAASAAGKALELSLPTVPTDLGAISEAVKREFPDLPAGHIEANELVFIVIRDNFFYLAKV